MTSDVIKDLQIKGGGRSSVVLTAVVIALVVGVFFIPELVNLKRSFVGAPQADRSSEVTPEAEVAPDIKVSDEVRASVRPSALKGVLDSIDVEPPAPSDAAPAEPQPAVVEGTKVTWELIQAGPGEKGIREARQKTIELAKALSKDYTGTHFALMNYINGLSMALESKSAHSMSADDMVRYLDSLDRAVTRAMAREQVERSDYTAWKNINLGEAFNGTPIGKLKGQYIIPFNPRLTLVSLQVQQGGNKYGQFQEKNKVYVRFGAFVFGKDITTITFVRDNGTVHRTVKLGRAHSNYRLFESPLLDGREAWTIRVEAKSGETYEKRYSFYPRVRNFTWLAKEKQYQMPFQMIEAKESEFEPQLVDRRLDRFFSLGTVPSLTAAAQRNYSTF